MRKITYSVPDELADAYHGAGYALAVYYGSQLIKIVYIADLLPDFDPENVEAYLTDDRLAPTIRELQPFGQISFGMLSGWEFTQL